MLGNLCELGWGKDLWDTTSEAPYMKKNFGKLNLKLNTNILQKTMLTQGQGIYIKRQKLRIMYLIQDLHVECMKNSQNSTVTRKDSPGFRTG